MSREKELAGLGLSEGTGDLVAECSEAPGVWLHVPARGSLRVALLCDRPLAYESHWAGGRMQVCFGAETCSLCKLGIGKKKRYVYTVFDTVHGLAGLLEVSPGTAINIEAACSVSGFARGLAFELRKEGGVSNGRIVASSLHSILRTADLPVGPDVVAVFRKMREEIAADRLPWDGVRAGAQQ